MSLKRLYDCRKSDKAYNYNPVPFTVPRLLNYSRQNRSFKDQNSTLPPLPPSCRSTISSSRWNSEPHMMNTIILSDASESPDPIKSSKCFLSLKNEDGLDIT